MQQNTPILTNPNDPQPSQEDSSTSTNIVAKTDYATHNLGRTAMGPYTTNGKSWTTEIVYIPAQNNYAGERRIGIAQW